MSAPRATPDQIKSCCAAAYGSDLVTMLLGDSYHPGGLTLTRRLASLLQLAPGRQVLDVAAGRGTTALLLAAEHGVHVDGVDLSTANITLARGAADAAGFAGQVVFTAGDAEHLPYPDTVFDAAVCECAFCTFPDKPAAASELARVLKPGARAGITDVVADPTRLPPELTGITAWVACIADAKPLDTYASLLAAGGLRVSHTERHDSAMLRMIDQIEARLTLARLTDRTRAETLGIDFGKAPTVLAAARTAVTDRHLGYALLVAEKPAG